MLERMKEIQSQLEYAVDGGKVEVSKNNAVVAISLMCRACRGRVGIRRVIASYLAISLLVSGR